MKETEDWYKWNAAKFQQLDRYKKQDTFRLICLPPLPPAPIYSTYDGLTCITLTKNVIKHVVCATDSQIGKAVLSNKHLC